MFIVLLCAALLFVLAFFFFCPFCLRFGGFEFLNVKLLLLGSCWFALSFVQFLWCMCKFLFTMWIFLSQTGNFLFWVFRIFGFFSVHFFGASMDFIFEFVLFDFIVVFVWFFPLLLIWVLVFTLQMFFVFLLSIFFDLFFSFLETIGK